MEKDLITVVVPVYNVEKYLDKCVKSIINQTYKNLEIILVDDGSTDKSGILCDEWEKKDSRIISLHKENGGLSSARNFGLKSAKGKYVTFVDSDDWIDKDTYEIIKNNNADIYIYGINDNYDSGKEIKKVPKIKGIFDSFEILIHINTFKNLDVSVCNKVFLKSLFDDIEFPYQKKCEDCYIIYKIIDKATKIYVSDECHYHYFKRMNSITRSKNINYDYVYASKQQLEYFENKYPKYKYIAKSNYAFCNLAIYNTSVIKNIPIIKNDEINVERNIKKYSKNVIINRHIPTKKKIQILIFIFMRKSYNKIIKNIKAESM